MIAVATVVDATVAASAARRFARRLGLDPRSATEIGIIVRELATNIARHAGTGAIHLRARFTTAGGQGELEVEAVDDGPRGVAPESLLGRMPGTYVDERGRPLPGLGEGLRAVERLSHRLEVRRAGARGLAVRALRRFDRPDQSLAPPRGRR